MSALNHWASHLFNLLYVTFIELFKSLIGIYKEIIPLCADYLTHYLIYLYETFRLFPTIFAIMIIVQFYGYVYSLNFWTWNFSISDYFYQYSYKLAFQEVILIYNKLL